MNNFPPLRVVTRVVLFSITATTALPMLAAPLYAAGDIALAKQAMATAQSSDLAYELVASLTSEVGPRLAGSANDARAVAWAKAKLTALGFDRVWTEPVKINKWTRGVAHADIVAPHPQHLAVAALGNSVSTPDEGISAELAYFENFEQLKTDASDRARGRIVFIDSSFVRNREGSNYGRNVGARVTGAIEAGRRGAVAVMIRSIGSDRDRLPHTGTMRYDEKVTPIPAVAVSNPDADLIARQVRGGRTVKISLTTKNDNSPGQQSHNVLAEIRGTEQPEQIVAIGGHLDSWDLGTGAIDDGAGVAITMAAAKIIKDTGVRPRRTIRLVLFANEENGLDGGRAYAAVHGKEKHQLVAESDLGAGSIYQFHTRVNDASVPWMKEIAAVLAPLGIAPGSNEASGGPDMGPLVKDSTAAAVTLAQDATDYFDWHHTANDTLDKIDPLKLKQNVAAWVALVWLAAQAEIDFAQPVAK